MNLFKKLNEKWLLAKEKKLTEAYAPELLALENEYRKKQEEFKKLKASQDSEQERLRLNQEDIDDLKKRMEDRKLELTSVNHELREQIRIIEAKGRPDQIWITAFSSGFNKAWDMMAPLMTEGVLKMKKAIHDQAIDETIRNLESTIAKRIDIAKKTTLKPVNDLLAKKNQLENRLQLTRDDDEKLAINNYLEALDWALNGNSLQKN